MPTFADVGVVSPSLLKALREKVSPPIQTPLALLSRDANALAKELGIEPSLMNQMRCKVAHELLSMNNNNDNDSKETEQAEEEEQRLIPTSTSLLQLYQQQQASTKTRIRLRTSSEALNQLLDLHDRYSLLQIMGPPASAKSQLCIDMALHVACASRESKVLYLSTTTPCVSLARRLFQCIMADKSIDKKTKQVILQQQVQFQFIPTKADLLQVLHQSPSSLCSSRSEHLLLIIDSLSLLRHRQSEWTFSDQVYVGRLLKQWSCSNNVTVIYTCSSKGGLGKFWQESIPLQCLELEPFDDDDDDVAESRRAFRAKLSSMDKDRCAVFEVGTQGIQDVKSK